VTSYNELRRDALAPNAGTVCIGEAEKRPYILTALDGSAGRSLPPPIT